jgi:hypothetical protein
LRAPIDAFFDTVTVNDDDPVRSARLEPFVLPRCGVQSRRFLADQGGLNIPREGRQGMSGYVFHFGGGATDPAPRARQGGGRRQGRQSGEMAAIGLPVPPGFTISAEICAAYAQGETHRRCPAAEVARALPISKT